MARIPLIALLTLVAVAWPVAAQSDLEAPLDSETPVAVESDGESMTVTVWVLDPSSPTCAVLGCHQVSALADTQAASCRATYMVWEPSDGLIPDISVTLDPDGCVRRIIDWVWPLWGTPASLLPNSLQLA